MTQAVVLNDVQLTLGDGAARVPVLRGVSLSIEAGETVGIVGPSGSGKSTLLAVLAGLEPPDQGNVIVAGVDLGRLDEDGLARFRGRSIGIVFQSFNLIPTMTALENVAVPLELAGRRDAFAVARAELDRVGLGARLDHLPTRLSGGEQQRVAIARALAPDPALIVADEPTGNLDAETGAAVSALLFRRAREKDATLILVTHDEALAAQCGRTVRMADGRIAAVSARRPATSAAAS